MTSRVKESGWGCLGKQDSLEFRVWIVGCDMGFLGYLGWNFCFGVWNELRAETQGGGGREGGSRGHSGIHTSWLPVPWALSSFL